ncbi:MAG: hypothetical protein HRU69_06915 [Flammeovirgaceae bacterium]|nr:MAG: hypothetical protein HRU69_06915 [Flammeovirgaceae bacterium]
MRPAVLLVMIVFATGGYGQSVVGYWQVIKQSICLGNEMVPTSETEEELSQQMAALAGPTPRVIQFNTDNTGEHNWKSVGKKKAAVRDKFLYKVADDTVYLLDKKSRLITDTYIIQVLTAESLVLVNKSRPCERIELVRVKQP